MLTLGSVHLMSLTLERNDYRQACLKHRAHWAEIFAREGSVPRVLIDEAWTAVSHQEGSPCSRVLSRGTKRGCQCGHLECLFMSPKHTLHSSKTSRRRLGSSTSGRPLCRADHFQSVPSCAGSRVTSGRFVGNPAQQAGPVAVSISIRGS